MSKNRESKKPPSYREAVNQEKYFKNVHDKWSGIDKPPDKVGQTLDPADEQEWFEKQIAKEAFDEYRLEYEKEQNPLYIWQTFQACLIAERVYNDKPMPDYVKDAWEWVKFYLARVAKNMLNGEAIGALPQYLEFKKGQAGHQFAKFKDHKQRLRAVNLVDVKLKKRSYPSIEKACEEVAIDNPQFMVDGKTILTWYHMQRP